MIIGLLTGRGGSDSQELPYKNTISVMGRPLMMYPYYSALESKLIDDIYLSTDGPELKEIAHKEGIKIIDRPDEFAKPDSQHFECMDHAIQYLSSNNIKVDIIVILMCNVAIQPIGMIDKCIQALLDDEKLDSAVTVREWGDHHPSRAKTFDHNGLLKPILLDGKENVSTTRQLLDPCYYLDHQVWAIRIRDGALPLKGQGPWYWMGSKIKPIENKELVFDIHTIEDVHFSEMWLKTKFRDFTNEK